MSIRFRLVDMRCGIQSSEFAYLPNIHCSFSSSRSSPAPHPTPPSRRYLHLTILHIASSCSIIRCQGGFYLLSFEFYYYFYTIFFCPYFISFAIYYCDSRATRKKKAEKNEGECRCARSISSSFVLTISYHRTNIGARAVCNVGV